MVEVGGWLLILELFIWLARQKLATTFANEYLLSEEQTTYYLRTSKSSFYQSTAAEKLDLAPKLKRKALDTWQPTEIL